MQKNVVAIILDLTDGNKISLGGILKEGSFVEGSTLQEWDVFKNATLGSIVDAYQVFVGLSEVPFGCSTESLEELLKVFMGKPKEEFARKLASFLIANI